MVVIANNCYAYSTPNERQFACAALLDKAIGYGIEAESVDGTDLSACLKALSAAVTRARTGSGPQIGAASLLRLCGHGEHDDAQYVDPRLRNSPVGRDCLKFAEAELLREGWADRAAVAAWREETIQQVEAAVAKVQREPSPDPYKENWCALASRHLSEGHDPV